MHTPIMKSFVLQVQGDVLMRNQVAQGWGCDPPLSVAVPVVASVWKVQGYVKSVTGCMTSIYFCDVPHSFHNLAYLLPL